LCDRHFCSFYNLAKLRQRRIDVVTRLRQRRDPGRLIARGRRLWLVTTLLDPKRYPRRVLADLYRQRWGIETRLGPLKTTMKLNVLRSLSLVGARYEVAATVLAHNLVWTLIHQAAHTTEAPPARISFADAIKAVLAFSAALRQAPPARRERLYNAMLRQIARRTNLHRPDRVGPRLVKRGPVRFCFLTISRDKARIKCLF
jgi:hypothetical protein